MTFCKRHWQALRDAIRDRGLEGLVAKDGQEAAIRMTKQVEGDASRTSFEPLLCAHNAIVANSLDICGLELLLPNEDGSEKCPICWLQHVHDTACDEPGCAHSFEPWIGHAADDMRNVAIDLGLMGVS